MDKSTKKISKFLSFALRHKPHEVGLVLDTEGWAKVDDLIKIVNQQNMKLDRDLLEQVVTQNDKQRFSFSEDGNSIRANQGHSIQVDLNLKAQEPPRILYHGTATRFLSSIQRQGLLKGQRHHVHLSKDEATAISVGQRHGKPVVLQIDAITMHKGGYEFFLSDNGVWLTEHVPEKYLLKLEEA